MNYTPYCKRLRDACDLVLGDKAYAPDGDKTFCNLAVRKIVQGMGMDLFFLEKKDRPMLANEMIAYMEKERYKFVQLDDGTDAHGEAMAGLVVIACEKGSAHGHVAVVYPGDMELSASWGKLVPMLANVGKKNGVMRASLCFQEEPRYFCILPF